MIATIQWKKAIISKLCLGTVQFGMEYGISNRSGRVKEVDAHEILDWAINKGVNCFDTAQAYGGSESVIGSYLKNRNALIDKRQMNVISKVSSKLFESDCRNRLEAVRDSLIRLSQDRIFALLLHDCGLCKTWGVEQSRSVHELIDSGMIQYFGASIYTSEEFEFVLNCDDMKVIQVPFNIFDQRAIKESWVQKALEKDKLILIRSVYLQGLLLFEKKQLPAKFANILPYIERLDFFAKEYKISRAQFLFSYVDSMSDGAVLLFGCDNLAQAQENINNYYERKLFSHRDIERINRYFSNISESVYNPTKW